MSISVVHMTSVHQRYDARIFLKECCSLAANKYRVFLVVADGRPDEVKDKVNILSVEKPKKRMDRVFSTTKRVYKKAVELDADIYHLHDPELMPVGLKLKRKGKKVIFDAHEDFPLQLLNKRYSKKWLLKILSTMAAVYESYACKKVDAVVTATPAIKEKFLKINTKTVDVNNFPILDDVNRFQTPWRERGNFACYVGGVAGSRGIYESVKAIKKCKYTEKLIVAGICRDEKALREMEGASELGKLQYLGYLQREGVAKIYSECKVGLVTLHPLENYLEALPVKLFEYMAAGVPVVASDIPLWKKIVEESGCGVCVNPFDVDEIAEAMDYIIENPAIAEGMSNKGIEAAKTKYSWDAEAEKLVGLYQEVLSL